MQCLLKPILCDLALRFLVGIWRSGVSSEDREERRREVVKQRGFFDFLADLGGRDFAEQN